MKVSKGQRFRARVDVSVTCMTAWAAPYTGSYERTLPRGEIVLIGMDPSEWATGVYIDPEDYDKLHEVMVPAEDRQQERYSGYYLAISFAQLEADFDPL